MTALFIEQRTSKNLKGGGGDTIVLFFFIDICRLHPIIQERFQHPNLIESIRTLQFIDKITKEDLFSKQIGKIVMTCSTSNNASLEKQWNSVGASTIKSILSLPSKNFPSSLDLLIRISFTLFGLEEFTSVLDEIFVRIHQRSRKCNQLCQSDSEA